jgi:hypothetical protein
MLILIAATAACVASIALLALDGPPAARLAATLCMFCLAPGGALLPLLGGQRALSPGLLLGVSLAVDAGIAELMVVTETFEPRSATYALAACCLPPLVLNLARLARPAIAGRRHRSIADTPRVVTPVELSEPIVTQPIPLRRDGTSYARGVVLVGLHGGPLGHVDVELDDDELVAERVVAAVQTALGDRVAAHLAADGLPVERLTVRGLTSTPNACAAHARQDDVTSPPALLSGAGPGRVHEQERP